MAKWIILSTVLTLALSFSPYPAQAFPPRITGRSCRDPLVHGPPTTHLEIFAQDSYENPGSETPPLTTGIPPWDEPSLLLPLNPQKPVAHLSGSTPFLANPSPSPGSSKVLKAGNLPQRVLNHAICYLNTPYRAGGSLLTGKATDCSGFVQYVYKDFHIDLPRSSSEQARVGRLAARKMDFSKLRPGDLLFFRRAGFHIGHVGIYLGEGKMIHASSRRRGVIVSDLHQPYYAGAFVVAKRLLTGSEK